MKKFFWLLVFLLALAGSAVPALGRPAPSISSDKQYFDPSNGLYFLKGNVCVETGSRTITADEARVDVAGLQVWARGNVTLRQHDMTFSGDSVFVNGGKHTAEITGNLYFVREGGLAISAEYAVYNWKTKIAHLTGAVVVARKNAQPINCQSAVYNVKTDVLTYP